MALVLKRIYNLYVYVMDDMADPRSNDYPLVSSPFPSLIILFFWGKFVFNWGPKFMKNRPPYDVKRIMIVYNIVQVLLNAYMAYFGFISAHLMNWSCTPVDYSESYWGREFLRLTYLYYLVKLVDLLDTVFFVLRKKTVQVSFLHTYHHFLMVIAAWIGVKYVGGGHSYYLGFVNTMVHVLLYSYYLLTAYDSKYVKLLWLKKLITQIQLAQFFFLLFIYTRLVLTPNCQFPKLLTLFLIPQNGLMIVLFGNFYIKTYITGPRRKKELEEQARKERELAANKEHES